MNSSQAMNSSTQNPVNREDADILNDVVSICRDGEELYRYAAERVDDQRTRSMFLEMAKVRLQILGELEDEESPLTAEPKHSGTTISNTRRWYAEAKNRVDFHQQEFVEQLEVTEKRALKAMRTLVKKLKNRSLMFRLSSLVATYQLSHDRMMYLNKSYK